MISLARPQLMLLGDFHLVPECGNLDNCTRMWDQIGLRFSPDLCFWKRAVLFNGIHGGGGRLHVPLGEYADTRNSRASLRQAVGVGWGLWLPQDKLGRWFSNCLAEPQSVLGVASGVLGEMKGVRGLSRLWTFPQTEQLPMSLFYISGFRVRFYLH